MALYPIYLGTTLIRQQSPCSNQTLCGAAARSGGRARHLEQPLPCAGVDGLPDAAQDAQRRAVMLLDPAVALATRAPHYQYWRTHAMYLI